VAEVAFDDVRLRGGVLGAGRWLIGGAAPSATA